MSRIRKRRSRRAIKTENASKEMINRLRIVSKEWNGATKKSKAR